MKTVKTSQVANRRELRFTAVDQILPEAERLARCEDAVLLGNWTLGQIFEHLGRAFSYSIDGASFRVPWRLRVLGWFIKGRILNNRMPAGFNAPVGMANQLEANTAVSTGAGLATLREGFRRYQAESKRAPHPLFGKLTSREWDQLHCNHAAMHLSFVIDPDRTG